MDAKKWHSFLIRVYVGLLRHRVTVPLKFEKPFQRLIRIGIVNEHFIRLNPIRYEGIRPVNRRKL